MSDKFLFLDLETFGLKARHDPIIEIAMVVTDSKLRVVDSFTSTVWESRHYLRYEDMRITIEIADKSTPGAAEWLKSETFVMKMHTDSCLFDKAMRERNSLFVVEKNAVAFARAYGFDNTDPVCGSSVGFDRGFLVEQMPSVDAIFSHRIVDVSSFKEVFRRKFPKRFENVTKQLYKMNSEDGLVQHTALDDCLMSINELTMYDLNFFREE